MSVTNLKTSCSGENRDTVGFEMMDTLLTEQDLKTVIDGLVADTASKNAPTFDERHLAVLQRDEKGNVIAAMYGKTVWNWLYIDLLWVDPLQQRKGWGARLVAVAEEEAIKRGCVGSYIWTESFQAPAFYARQGYKQFVVMPDFPKGHQRIGFMKRLAA